LALDRAVETTFCAAFDGGANLAEASRAADAGRSTAYRWWQGGGVAQLLLRPGHADAILAELDERLA
jgi:transposase-like protein